MLKFKNQTIAKEYKGKTFRIIVASGKYFIGSKKGKKAHRSLSGVAEAITGHPTSGKGFFGLLK